MGSEEGAHIAVARPSLLIVDHVSASRRRVGKGGVPPYYLRDFCTVGYESIPLDTMKIVIAVPWTTEHIT